MKKNSKIIIFYFCILYYKKSSLFKFILFAYYDLQNKYIYHKLEQKLDINFCFLSFNYKKYTLNSIILFLLNLTIYNFSFFIFL